MLQNLQQYKFNLLKFSEFKHLQAVPFVSSIYQKLCKTNVSRTLHDLCSVHDSTVE